MTEALRWRSLAAVWRRHAVALLRTWRVAITWFLIEPAFVLVAMGAGVGRLIDELPGHGSYALFVTPGLVIGMAMFHALFECGWGAFNRIQQGHLETMATAPATLTELAAGEVIWGGTRGFISTLAVGALALLLGWLPLAAMPGILLVSTLVGLQFGSVGLCFAAASPNLSTLTLVFTVVATPLFFFSGSFFPIETLPGALQPLAWAAPLTPGVHLARGFTVGGWDVGHLAALAYLLLQTVALFPLAVWLLRRRLVK